MEKQVAFNEIYLYGLHKNKLSISRIYKELTQDGKLELTQPKLFQYLLNIKNTDLTDIDLSALPKKDVYTYEDLILLDIDNKNFLMKKPLGQYFQVNEKYHFTVSPFDVIIYDTFLEDYAESIVSTQNKHLLLEFGKIEFNTLYLCLAKDVFNYSRANSLSVKTSSKVYFPFLYNKEIETLSDLQTNKQQLLEDDKELISSNFRQNMRNISMFYDVYHNRNKDLEYLSRGIKDKIYDIPTNDF